MACLSLYSPGYTVGKCVPFIVTGYTIKIRTVYPRNTDLNCCCCTSLLHSFNLVQLCRVRGLLHSCKLWILCSRSVLARRQAISLGIRTAGVNVWCAGSIVGTHVSMLSLVGKHSSSFVSSNYRTLVDLYYWIIIVQLVQILT